jgi:hypothetical protein
LLDAVQKPVEIGELLIASFLDLIDLAPILGRIE